MDAVFEAKLYKTINIIPPKKLYRPTGEKSFQGGAPETNTLLHLPS